MQLQDEATKRHRTLTYYPCDISDLEATTSVFRNAVAASRFPLRGLVNCAGIGWLGDTIDFPLDDARRILDVNLVGTLVCAQAGAKLVREHGLSASFVFIASMSGYVVNKVRKREGKIIRLVRDNYDRLTSLHRGHRTRYTRHPKPACSSLPGILRPNGVPQRRERRRPPPSASTLLARVSSGHP